MTSFAELRYSRRVNDLVASPIREILAVIEQPGMVSFAGGLPAPQSFPTLEPGAVPSSWLQYGPSEGEPALRRHIARELATLGMACTPQQVLVLSGSQQGIDLVAKLFIDPGTPVAVECPTYLAALQVFRFFGARFVAFDPTRADTLCAGGVRPALAYTIPTFQNPTGLCHDAHTRSALAGACDDADVVLFEDDPYRDLAYDPCDRIPVCALVRRASWIYQGSFSKSLAPGLRLGFMAVSPDLVAPLTRLKQAADMHSSRVSQWLVLQQLEHPQHAARLASLVHDYRARRNAFGALLTKHLGELATWTVPPGGLFFWLTLAQPLDTRTLLPRAIERRVAFMPGEPFFPGSTPVTGRLRLNFSHASEHEADRGLRSLAELLRETASNRTAAS
ncbi:MAG: PLP-dependent aminotransferase family protein [Rubrivivax sp.]